MALSETVEHYEVGDLIEFNDDKRIRKKVIQSRATACELICYVPGQGTVQHKHPAQDEIFFIIEGEGTITFEDRDDIPVKKNGVVFVPAGVSHGIDANGPGNLVAIFFKGPGVMDKAAKGFMLGEQPGR